MAAMQNFIARVKVVSTAFVTYATVLAFAFGIAADEIEKAFPDSNVSGLILSILASAIAILGVAVAIIRRVTPVIPEDRGILPHEEVALPEGPDNHPGPPEAVLPE